MVEHPAGLGVAAEREVGAPVPVHVAQPGDRPQATDPAHGELAEDPEPAGAEAAGIDEARRARAEHDDRLGPAVADPAGVAHDQRVVAPVAVEIADAGDRRAMVAPATRPPMR